MTGHVHDLKPDRLPKPTVYDCSSCAFSCTPRAVLYVERSKGKHRLVRRVNGKKPAPWDLP